MEYNELQKEDSIMEILIHLPIKSIVRFECVSKYWCALIKSSTFCTRHLEHDRKETLLVKRYMPPQHETEHALIGGDDILSFYDPDCPELFVSPNIDIPFFKETYHEQMDLYGSCNGLVCFMLQEIIVLSNPALREFKLLEPSSFTCPEAYKATNYGSGFGFDSKTNDYKIIQMWQIKESGVYYYFNADSSIRIDLYNLSTNSWRIMDDLVPRVNYDPGFDLFFDGACHWGTDEFIEGTPDMGTILAFHVSDEAFQKFEYPLEEERDSGLVALNNCLALIYFGNDLIDIWLMKEYGVKESWTKELVIAPYHFRWPLLCWKNEQLIVHTREAKLAFCAIHRDEMNILPVPGYGDSFRALIYTESLVSLY